MPATMTALSSLEYVPKPFRHKASSSVVRFLDLSNNSFTEFPRELMFQFPSLRHLNMNHNRMEYSFPRFFFFFLFCCPHALNS